MPHAPTIDADQAAAIGLSALAWTLADDTRAERLVALTGLEPADLRARLGEPAMLAAALRHLEAYEPDLLACADALDRAPATLVAARHMLDGGGPGE